MFIANETQNAEQNHWSERGRTTSGSNASTLGRPRRSVLSLAGLVVVATGDGQDNRLGAAAGALSMRANYMEF
jgi:hypothetical protein